MQFCRTPASSQLKKTFRSPHPACNVQHRQEPLATDTVHSDTPAIDDGSKVAQIFVGTESCVIDVHGMKTESQFVNTLQDIILSCGAPTKLISNSAQTEIGNEMKDILRHLHIEDWQSEACHQHQNPCERCHQDMKCISNWPLDCTNSPPPLTLAACIEVHSFPAEPHFLVTIGWQGPSPNLDWCHTRHQCPHAVPLV